jgi:uncharacterized protein
MYIMKNPKYYLFKSDKNDQFYFRLQAGNGEPVLNSEGYVNKRGAENGISSVKTNCSIDSRYDRIDNPNNYRFNLKGGNGEIIGRSQSYTTASARETGIASVKVIGPTAPVDDQT